MIPAQRSSYPYPALSDYSQGDPASADNPLTGNT